MTGRLRSPGLRQAAGIVVTVLLAACGGPAGTTSPPTTATAASAAPPARESTSPTAAPTPPTPSSPSMPVSSAGASLDVVVDASLLERLPVSVGGVPLTSDPETAAELARDPSLATSIADIAVATAFGPAATDSETDYAVVTIVRLRPDTFSDAFFRDWRDTFDAAVCGQAGGVTGHAETTIGDHPTWIGTCAGGVHTWHTALDDGAVLVSLQGAGPNRFGEQIVAGSTE